MKCGTVWVGRGIVIALVLATAGAAASATDGGWELWSSFKVSAAVNDRFGVFVTPQLRYQDDFDTWYYERYDLGLSFKLSDRWKIEPFYSRLEKKASGDWNVSDLGSADAYYTVPIEAWGAKFENRARFEVNFDNEREAVRDRVKLSKQIPSWEGVSAFASNEIIFDLSGGEFKENRLAAGIRKSFECGFSVEGGYQLTSRRQSGHWDDYNTIFVNLGYSF